ncbi:hypothetical protein GHT06_003838 [Daphnia sinensis]|uniref:Uncharacterized protein n=1 Tax=Daphnia sinensis TaxID=1820382 RepID=A0AAD5KEW3_9CRUS|nr:hypothetical protein GHT06_003838 [Daphnia sinensis]
MDVNVTTGSLATSLERLKRIIRVIKSKAVVAKEYFTDPRYGFDGRDPRVKRLLETVNEILDDVRRLEDPEYSRATRNGLDRWPMIWRSYARKRREKLAETTDLTDPEIQAAVDRVLGGDMSFTIDDDSQPTRKARLFSDGMGELFSGNGGRGGGFPPAPPGGGGFGDHHRHHRAAEVWAEAMEDGEVVDLGVEVVGLRGQWGVCERKRLYDGQWGV